MLFCTIDILSTPEIEATNVLFACWPKHRIAIMLTINNEQARFILKTISVEKKTNAPKGALPRRIIIA
jgi:hypothetical protein